MDPVQNIHVVGSETLITPRQLKALMPLTDRTQDIVLGGRRAVRDILRGEDSRMLVIVGPCSIHDPQGAREYGQRLNELRKAMKDRFEIVMRVYFEKPRTTIGWKGLINDPRLDGSMNIEEGLKTGRELMIELSEMGMPLATEFLDPIVPQYISDLVSWAAIGARTTESQTHRQMASGLSMPVGFKNGTDGGLQVAINAMSAAMHPHSFLGIDQDGVTCVFRTKGNPWGHIVLRGGEKRTNFDSESIEETEKRLSKEKVCQAIMVDCSHANSGKEPARQEQVWTSVLEQRLKGNDRLIGLMLESYLGEGNQPIASPEKLKYGISITDACISWETTERLLRLGYEELRGNDVE